MKKQLAEELLQKYIEGKCTEHEKALVETWYLKQKFDNPPYLSTEDRNQDLDEIWDSVRSSIVEKPGRLRRWYSTIAAAALILAVCTAGFFLFSTNGGDPDFSPYVQAPAQDVQPGGNSATLTLSDGSRIELDSIANGEVVSYNGVRFI